MIFEQTVGSIALGETQQAELRAAVRESPAEAGNGLADWKVVHQFVRERRSVSLSRSSYLNYLHRLGFAFKRPKNRLAKVDERKRESLVAEDADVADGARSSEAKIFFADEALFQADAEMRGKWVLRGEPTLVDSSNPHYGGGASYHSAICLKTEDVERVELEENSNAGISAAFLKQLTEHPVGPLNVKWDNARPT